MKNNEKIIFYLDKLKYAIPLFNKTSIEHYVTNTLLESKFLHNKEIGNYIYSKMRCFS